MARPRGTNSADRARRGGHRHRDHRARSAQGARVIELAAVRLRRRSARSRGRVPPADRSGRADPASATRHSWHRRRSRRRCAALRRRPGREIAAALGDAILIGHTVGFDLAVLKRECARAGLGLDAAAGARHAPARRDRRAEPADFSLESLAAWLGLEIADRHSALGDALPPARVFDALIPKLRDRNIRTLAEAIRACRALTRVLDQHHRAGWSETTPARRRRKPGRADRQLSVPPPRRGPHDAGTVHRPRSFGRRARSMK